MVPFRLNVAVMNGGALEARSVANPSPKRSLERAERLPEWLRFIAAALAVFVATMASDLVFGRFQLSDVVMVYLLVIVLVSMQLGYGPSIWAAVLSVAALDFTFVPPYLSFRVSEPRRVVTFVILFMVALIIVSLTKRVRDQAALARRRENRTARLYAMSRELAGTLGIPSMVELAVRHLQSAFDAKIVLLMPSDSSAMGVTDGSSSLLDQEQLELAQWLWMNERSTGLGTDVFPSSSSAFRLLRGSRGKVGSIVMTPANAEAFCDPDRQRLLDAFCAQIGSALDRGRLAEAAERASVEAETERLRSALLSCISHDLRTPLSVITGATSTLMEDSTLLTTEARQELVESAHEEAERMNRLVGNLLDMTRLASGSLEPNKEWHPLEEIIGVALNRLELGLRGRSVEVILDRAPLAVPLDAILIEQVFINLLENALKYTPAGTPIEICAVGIGSIVHIAISDRGPGIPEARCEKIFEKFFRLKDEVAPAGAGLGLAICRGIVQSHGGRIWVEARGGGGSIFRFTLPLGENPSGFGHEWQRAS